MISSQSIFSIDYLIEEFENHKFHSSKLKERISLFLKALQKFEPLNLKMLKSLAFYGIPDEIRCLRSLYWRILLGYLPENRSKWSDLLEKNQKVYESFIDEFITKRNEDILSMGEEFLEKCNWEKYFKIDEFGVEGGLEILENDQISEKEKEKVKAIYNDLVLWDEIEKDTKRTRSEMHFFVSKANNSKEKSLLLKLNLCLNPKLRVWSSEKLKFPEEKELHNDVLSRILFIYAKLNSGIKYVQGMNEIAGTLYYCFSNEKNETLINNCETDAFFCFTLIMGEIKDGFIRNFDQAASGLKGRIADLNNLLKKIDLELWNHFENEKVNPYFYSLRWVMLMLTQEFELHDILRLWDSLLSHPNKTLYLNYCCVAIILSMRNELINEDFSGIMERLQQNISDKDIQSLMNLAYSLYLEHSGCDPISTFVII